MNRPISTRAHGMIDYTWATLAAAVPGMLADATATKRLVRGASAAATANSMVTNYEAGVMKVMPMKAHLAMDVVMCTALLRSPLYLPRSERRYSVIPMLLGAAGLLTALMTQTESPDEYAFTPSRELSEAVADPDVSRNSEFQSYLE